MNQLDIFGSSPCSSSEAEMRRFGRMDALTGLPRLNDFRIQHHGAPAFAYDDGYRAGIAELKAKQGQPA